MENDNVHEVDNVGSIPRYYHEGEVARLERIITRLFWALILTILLLVATNAGWVWYESQFEDVTVTESYASEADGSGLAIVNRGGSVITNGNPSAIHQDN